MPIDSMNPASVLRGPVVHPGYSSAHACAMPSIWRVKSL